MLWDQCFSSQWMDLASAWTTMLCHYLPEVPSPTKANMSMANPTQGKWVCCLLHGVACCKVCLIPESKFGCERQGGMMCCV